MTGYVYPRLPWSAARGLLDAYRAGGVPGWEVQHSDAVPYEHGEPVPEPHLRKVRDAVERATERCAAKSPTGDAAKAEWDRAVGQALCSTMEIIEADAANDGVWSFMTLVLLPDIAVQRFPLTSADVRFFGGLRNTFRRTWERERVLRGLEVPEGAEPLGEDELVGLFERSCLARNRLLVRLLAAQILLYGGPERSKQFARPLTRRVRAYTGPYLLDLLPPSELVELVGSVAREISPGIRVVDESVVRQDEKDASRPGGRVISGGARTTNRGGRAVPHAGTGPLVVRTAPGAGNGSDGSRARLEALVDAYRHANPFAGRRELEELGRLLEDLLDEYSDDVLLPAVRNAVDPAGVAEAARKIQDELDKRAGARRGR